MDLEWLNLKVHFYDERNINTKEICKMQLHIELYWFLIP